MTDIKRRALLKSISLAAIAAAVPATDLLAKAAPDLRDVDALTEYVRRSVGAKSAMSEDFDFGFRLGVALEMPDGRRNGVTVLGGRRDFEAMTAAQRHRVAEKMVDAFKSWALA